MEVRGDSTITMQLDFSGKRVFVVDDATGLGRRVAQEFHALGATVAINAISENAISKTIQQLGGGDRLLAAPGDLSLPTVIREVVPRAISALSGLDVLV